ncbi:Structure-specific endonuclease ERCC1-XPF, catalytic component XPF/ERCC4 [Trachipleistophora hominis]|uniref:Structure-specific endonuclease ERCC1-XPF, catalytic component XPF/ERCC4 n=1 Tax=Trachipleistophora hominis TaxID=72359 RepID=L7JRE0_TRAHO|nr:Structure-specific endonuclease ERCC1-XPF, catalytic component XPF/ERCC4 [Trachipleistophora hominis]
MKLLNYEKLILKECSSESHLLVMAEGLNLPKIVTTLASLYNYPDTLCLIINTDDQFDVLFADESFTSLKTSSTSKRLENYKVGGVKICQAQTLISDLLNRNLDVQLIAAIFVVNAEDVKENSVIAFILHYIALNSSNTVIKAFTENAIKVSRRYFHLNNFLDILKVRNVILFPRFQKDINDELSTSSEFIEVKMKMSGWLEEIQLYLLDLIQSVKNEMEKYNKNRVSFNDYYTHREEHSIDSDNKKKVESHVSVNVLNNISHTLQGDLSHLMRCIELLFTLDLNYFITFFSETYNYEVSHKGKTWILNSASHMIMEVIGKMKMEKGLSNKSMNKNDDDGTMNTDDVKRMKIEVEKEKNIELGEESVHENIPKNDGFIDNNEIDMDTKETIRSEVLTKSLVTVDEEEKHNLGNEDRKRCKSKFKNQKLVELKKILVEHDDEDVLIVSKYEHNKDVVLAQDMKSRIEFVKHKNLSEIKQNIVILLDFNLGTFRKIERMQKRMRIYLLYYKESHEEEEYVRRIREEKDAFERFINDKAKLGLQDFNFFIDVDEEIFDIEEKDTDLLKSKYNVLVDFRELRASLPFFLYKAKNNLRVVCLEEGDYLFDNFIVERKTVYDLIMSLNNGRLLSQMTRLFSNHSNYYLLIEYENKLSLGAYSNRNETFRNGLISKFVLLAIKFPRLKFIYTNNDLLSARLLRCLQRKEMSVEKVNNLEIDPYLLELLLSIPGINSFCVRRIQQGFNSLSEMIGSSEEKLIRVLGNERGKIVHDFFNK